MDPTTAWTFLAGLLVIIALAAGVRVVALRRARRRTEQLPQDLRRAGESPEPTSGSAAERAQGSAAWMRPDGGGF